MAALDTNVLVRFVVQDHATQGRAAASLMRLAAESGQTLFVPVTVLLELEWVLRSAFGFDKPAVLQALLRLLGAFELSFQFESVVEEALSLYERDGADFADCLHAALAGQAGEQPLWTFDKAASKVAGAQLLA